MLENIKTGRKIFSEEKVDKSKTSTIDIGNESITQEESVKSKYNLAYHTSVKKIGKPRGSSSCVRFRKKFSKKKSCSSKKSVKCGSKVQYGNHSGKNLVALRIGRYITNEKGNGLVG